MALSAEETLYNLSLGYIGEFVVTEGLQSQKQYKFCSRYYEQARDEVLVLHPWNECMVSAMIVQDSVNPIFGYDRKYLKPSDALRIISVDDDFGSDQRNNAQGINNWEVEGDYILSNAGVTPPTWKTDTDYVIGQFFTDSSITYEVLVTHTSDTVANDIASGDIVSSGGDYRVIYVTYVKQLTDIAKFSPRLKQAIAMKLAIKVVTGLTNDIQGKDMLVNEFERLAIPKARSVDAMQGVPRQHFNSQWIRSRQSGTI